MGGNYICILNFLGAVDETSIYVFAVSRYILGYFLGSGAGMEIFCLKYLWRKGFVLGQ